jgi:hypothetical protein
VIHRDIKPENVLLSEDGAVKIADFGIAKIGNAHSDRRITATRQVLGTVHYLAPEQLESPNEVDHRVDIYALGVIFYELLTKQLPVGHFEVPSLINPNVERRVDPIVMRSLHRRPTMRFQSAAEVKQAIESLSLSSPSAEANAPFIEPIDATSIVSLPFSTDDMAGFASVHGTIQANANGLVVEYRVVDAIFGSIKSKLRTLTLPWDRLASVECRRGVFSGKLKILADSISVFEDFPGSEEGHFEVTIKGSDFELADRFIEKVRSTRPQLIATGQRSMSLNHVSNPLIAVLLIFFGILNAGGLAISQVVVASLELEDWIQAICAVAIAVSIGPITVMQILCGIIYGTTSSRTAGTVGAIVSMIPVSPFIIASFPFGLWARKQLSDPQASRAPVVSPTSTGYGQKGWGLTTMIFLRDSKHARLASILESVGYVALFGLLGIWLFGWYPSTMNYRLVGKARSEDVLSFAKSRLQDIGVSWVKQVSDDRYEVRCWNCQRKKVEDRFALPSSPKLVVLAKQGAASAGDLYLPVVQSESIEGLEQRKTKTGIELKVESELVITSEYVSSVTIAKNEITIVWTNLGRKEIQKALAGSEGIPVIGLAIGGWVEAIASPESTQDKSFRLKWSSGSARSLASVQSSIRGPSLDTELELID